MLSIFIVYENNDLGILHQGEIVDWNSLVQSNVCIDNDVMA